MWTAVLPISTQEKSVTVQGCVVKKAKGETRSNKSTSILLTLFLSLCILLLHTNTYTHSLKRSSGCQAERQGRWGGGKIVVGLTSLPFPGTEVRQRRENLRRTH